MKKTLFIQLERLGDLIQTTPLLEDYRRANPDEEIHLLLLEENRSAIAGFTSVDRCHYVLQKRVGKLNQQIDQGRNQEHASALLIINELELPTFDRLINLTHGALGCWLADRLSADVKEGGLLTAEGDWLWQGAWHAYLLAMPDFRQHNRFNIVDLYRGAGPGGPIDPLRRPYVNEADRLPFEVPQGRLIALNPGASRANRRWPANAFGKLAGLLSAQGLTPLLVGAPSDIENCAEVAMHCDTPIYNVCGKTSVAEMAALLAHCDLLVSNDTGAIHIASGVGTRCVGLYGSSAWFSETAPWGSGHLIIQALPDMPMSSISLNTVAATVNAALAGSELSTTGTETVWRTHLDADDPLGGITYELLTAQPSEEQQFMEYFRGSFSRILMGKNALSAQSPHCPLEVDALAAAQALTRMATLAQDALAQVQSGASDAHERVEALGKGLESGLEALIETADRLPHIAPPVYWLRWVLRTTPLSNLPELLSLRAKECLRAAQILETTVHLHQGTDRSLPRNS